LPSDPDSAIIKIGGGTVEIVWLLLLIVFSVLAFAGIIWVVIKVWESIDDLTREDERKRLAYERWYRSLPLEQQYLIDQQERQRAAAGLIGFAILFGLFWDGEGG
jgi:hypothetical protein